MIVKKTSDSLDKQLTFGNFLRYIGLWLVITPSLPGNINRIEFWSLKPVSRKRGAPFRLNDLMSKNRFKEIISNLTYTDQDPPPYKDLFWEVRQMISAWNANMKERFTAAWVVCLDESMSIWTNRWSCPGWVFCPRKPHPIGNEYHTIACGKSGILFAMEMVEGKQRPNELPSPPANRRTIHLLLSLC